MSATEQNSPAEKQPKDRSPSFPYVGLSKAFERTQLLYNYAKRHDSRVADAAKPAWDMAPKSSSTLQTVAALLAFGLVEVSGSGNSRKIKISDLAYRALVDQRQGAKEAALAEAACKPKLLAEYIRSWGSDRPPEANCLSELTLDRGFTPDGAKAFLRVFDDTVRYASPTVSDKSPDAVGTQVVAQDPPPSEVEVGDSVQVEIDGQLVTEKAAVREIHEQDGQKWVFVEGFTAGAKMSETTLVEKAPPPLPTKAATLRPERTIKEAHDEGLDQFTVDEGVVKITFPNNMTGDSVADLEAFLQLFIKKAKRRAVQG